MYLLSEKQIDYIINDIGERGVEMETLKQDLLDHVCCIIEQNLEENGDFESFYLKTIKTFYKNELWEIEEETISLLIFKNYYTMKKMMMISGMFSALTIVIGIWFKIMHYPGAAIIMPMGIFIAGLIFMPLLFTLKMKEQQSRRDKFVIVTGALSVGLLSLSFAFKLVNGPFLGPIAMNLFYISMAIILILFLPVYVFSGIRNPATKVNTLATASLVIMGYAILFSFINNSRSWTQYRLLFTNDFVRNQQILNTERQLLKQSMDNDTTNLITTTMNEKIDAACEALKSEILKTETGSNTIAADFEEKDILLRDHLIYPDKKMRDQLFEIKALVNEYNSKISGGVKIPIKSSFIESAGGGGTKDFSTINALVTLNQIIQVQMFVLQNERGYKALAKL